MRGTQFRIWATQKLKEYIVKGFVMDDERLAEGKVVKGYFDEFEERVAASKNQPPPPDPEMIKAQAQAQLAQVKAGAEDAKSKSEIQVAQLTSQAEMARAQADIRVQEVQLESERRLGQVTAQLDAMRVQLEAMQSAEKNDTDMKKAKLAFLQATTVAQINAGAQTDVAQLNAQIETILGFAKIEHDAEQTDLQHEHDRTMQAEAPKPTGPAK